MQVAQTTSLPLPTGAVFSPVYPTLFPSVSPTITRDTWQCATVNASQYFDPPKATGDLLTALISYADNIAKDCTRTRLEANPTEVPSCPFPEVSQWCAFSKVMEPSLTATYSAYGSAASSWWAAKSSGASSVAARCPKTWFKVMVQTPAGAPWLNETIIFSECYVSAHVPAAHAPTAHASALSTGKPSGI